MCPARAEETNTKLSSSHIRTASQGRHAVAHPVSDIVGDLGQFFEAHVPHSVAIDDQHPDHASDHNITEKVPENREAATELLTGIPEAVVIDVTEVTHCGEWSDCPLGHPQLLSRMRDDDAYMWS